MREIRKCCICGTEFVAMRANVRACNNPECKTEAKKERQRLWYKKNYLAASTKNREYMRKVRAEDKPDGPHVRKPDTIVAIGYAERQMAKSLAMAGKVSTEL